MVIVAQGIARDRDRRPGSRLAAGGPFGRRTAYDGEEDRGRVGGSRRLGRDRARKDHAVDGGVFDDLARRLAGRRGRRAVLVAAAGAVAAAARALLPSAAIEAQGQGRCRHIFERCRWDDDCCSNHCNGNRCGKGEHGEERRTTRVRRRRERRRVRQRQRLEQQRRRLRNRKRQQQNRRTATATATTSSTTAAFAAAQPSEAAPAGEPR
jgi:hypothetical protein